MIYHSLRFVHFISWLGGRFLAKMLFLSIYFGHSAIALAGGVPDGNSERLWCRVNSNVVLPGNSGASVALPKSDILLVKKEAQAEAQGLLHRKAFVALTERDVARFVGQLEIPKDNSHFYVVRASAVYDSDTYLESTVTLAASLYPKTRTLNVYSFSLRGPDVKIKNLALVVRTPSLIDVANAVCETAS